LADALAELIASRFALQRARDRVSVGATEIFGRAVPIEGCFSTVKRGSRAIPGSEHPVNGCAIVRVNRWCGGVAGARTLVSCRGRRVTHAGRMVEHFRC
jgi:hypothetical protein